MDTYVLMNGPPELMNEVRLFLNDAGGSLSQLAVCSACMTTSTLYMLCVSTSMCSTGTCGAAQTV